MAPKVAHVIVLDDSSGEADIEMTKIISEPPKSSSINWPLPTHDDGGRRRRSLSALSSASSCTLRAESEVEMEEQMLEAARQTIKEVHEHRNAELYSESTIFPQLRFRNQPVTVPFVEVTSIKWNGFIIQVGTTVEIIGGDFVRVKMIIKDLQNDNITLRGWLLRRLCKLKGKIEMKLNELCYVFYKDKDDERDACDQCVFEIGLDVVKAKRILVRSNLSWVEDGWKDSCQDGESRKDTVERIRKQERLYVRWKCIRSFENATARLNCTKIGPFSQEETIERLQEEECTKGYSVTAEKLRYAWRGETILGGSGSTRRSSPAKRKRDRNSKVTESFRCNHCGEYFLRSENLVNHHQLHHDQPSQKDVPSSVDIVENLRRKLENAHYQSEERKDPNQSYSYSDGFSGAGCAARGALMAGLEVVSLFDYSKDVQDTLKANFPGAEIHCATAEQFVGKYSGTVVDILHLSPPCQFWSQAHRKPGKDDEWNKAALFAITECLKAQKPRLVTVEQNYGILEKEHEMYFNVGLIQAFTCAGYSLSWKVVHLQDLGLPQMRKRLVIIAACPGETLPDFPPSTHCANPSRAFKSFTRPCDVIRQIPRTAPNHDINRARGKGNYRNWDGNKLAKCITTAGGENCSHPSGERSLTHRELASLNGIPLEHVFYGKDIRKQIGNGVPSLCWKYLMTHLRKYLEHVDGVGRAAN